MSFLSEILSLPAVDKVIDRVIPDKQKQAELKLELARLQIEDNIESRKVLSSMFQNKSWFVSGAIPSIIWMASLMLFNNYVLLPWAEVFGYTVPQVVFPDGYFSLLGTIVIGLFGKKVFDENEIRWGSFYSPPKRK